MTKPQTVVAARRQLHDAGIELADVRGRQIELEAKKRVLDSRESAARARQAEAEEVLVELHAQEDAPQVQAVVFDGLNGAHGVSQ